MYLYVLDTMLGTSNVRTAALKQIRRLEVKGV